MSRFNTATKTSKVENLAGGQAYSQSPELEIVSILLTSFVKDQFYRSADDTLIRLRELTQHVSPEFGAKLAIYARNEFGMRSITHALAAELAPRVSGQSYAKSFYDKVVARPDDMMEILSYRKNVLATKGITHAMEAGFRQAFNRFDGYQLAKYRGENKDIKLIDIVNLVHPKGTEKNAEALKQLVNGTLRSADTWEVNLSSAGQKAESDEEKAELKADAWRGLINERKIGYFALLKNLRNIIEQAPDILTKACALLTDEKLIRNSKVLPFRFTTAFEEIAKLNGSKDTREVMVALNKALDVSCANVPKFDGETLVVLDESGSMAGQPAKIGALFASVLVKGCNADLLTFANDARYRSVNPMDSVTTIAQSIVFNGGGTNFHSIFQRANKKYDRIVILSDMQGWVGFNTPQAIFNAWKMQHGANPFVYSWDLAGHGTLQFPEQKVFCLAGFSDKVFDLMNMLEQDKNAMIAKINAVEI